MRIQLAALSVLALLFASAPLQAAPIVSYTVTGTTNDWVLDFSVTNTLGVPTQDIYFFGVALDARDIVGSPTDFNPDTYPSFNNFPYGGSNITYNNVWIRETGTPGIPMGATVGGFLVHVTTATAPTTVNWTAWSVDDVNGAYTYGGGDNFNESANSGDLAYNPGFEGTAGVAPEPTSLLLLGSGLAAVAVRVRRRNVRRA